MGWEDILGDRSNQTILLLIVIRESIMESGEIIRYMGLGSILGVMEGGFQGTGGIIRCMGLGYTNGQTAKNS